MKAAVREGKTGAATETRSQNVGRMQSASFGRAARFDGETSAFAPSTGTGNSKMADCIRPTLAAPLRQRSMINPGMCSSAWIASR
jgi:hypothetical protein